MLAFNIDHTDMPFNQPELPERELVASVLRTAVEDLVAPPPRSYKGQIEWRHMRDDAFHGLPARKRIGFPFCGVALCWESSRRLFAIGCAVRREMCGRLWLLA
jgi:hypothetical protein